MYGETPDMSGGFGQEGVDAFAKFLEGGGTLIARRHAIRFPIEFGWARTVDTEPVTGVTAQRPIVQAEIVRPDHPVFYGYADKTIPIKYVGSTVLRVGVADQAQRARAVRRRRRVGAERPDGGCRLAAAARLRHRSARGVQREGRVILLFANNPIYRWQNHGEFNMIFNSLLNWNYVP